MIDAEEFRVFPWVGKVQDVHSPRPPIRRIEPLRDRRRGTIDQDRPSPRFFQAVQFDAQRFHTDPVAGSTGPFISSKLAVRPLVIGEAFRTPTDRPFDLGRVPTHHALSLMRDFPFPLFWIVILRLNMVRHAPRGSRLRKDRRLSNHTPSDRPQGLNRFRHEASW